MIRTIAVAAAVLACLWASTLAAQAQSAPERPKTPGEIAAASRKIAERNEACRLEANAQHLHLIKRRSFMRTCKKRKS